MDIQVLEGKGYWSGDRLGSADTVLLAVVAGSAVAEASASHDRIEVHAGQVALLAAGSSVRVQYAGEGVLFPDAAGACARLAVGSVHELDPVSAGIIREVLLSGSADASYRLAAARFLACRLAATGGAVADEASLVERVLAYMDAHLDEPLGLDVLAGQFGCSRTTLQERFQSTLDRSPMRVLAEKRLMVARRELELTSRSITDIARSVGYAELSSFTRFFKAQTGLSPRAVRDRARWVV